MNVSDRHIRINIACGDVFVEGWDNLDYSPAHSEVKRANLLGRLPFADGSVEVVYSSHFLEHIPYDALPVFLSECFRILRKGGRLRLVTPDFEALCREYLRQRDLGADSKAEFVILEILDQCVRLKPGGRLAEFYRRLSSDEAAFGGADLIEYVKWQTGSTIRRETAAPPVRRHFTKRLATAAKHWRKLALQYSVRMREQYCRFICWFLPRAFRDQNVSFARPGERHAWLWDFHTLAAMLNDAGFARVGRFSHDTSGIGDFPFRPLDTHADGAPRKGAQSMYVEAIK